MELNPYVHNYNTWRKVDIHIQSYNTEMYKKSVINMGTKVYNKLPGCIRENSDSPPRVTHPRIFSLLSTSIFTHHEEVEPYLQRHPYTNIRFGFPSSPYLPHDFFPPLYLHFNFSWSGGPLSQTSPLRQHQIRIYLLALPTVGSFFRLSTPIFTHHEAVEPYPNVTPTSYLHAIHTHKCVTIFVPPLHPTSMPSIR